MLYAEFLLPFETANGICSDKKTLLSLISTNSNFHVTDDKITFKKTEYNITIKKQTSTQQDVTIFYIKIETKSDIHEHFYEMLNVLKKTIGHHLKNNILCTWNGVSYEWAKELYSQIYEVENYFRKLISQLMLCTVGKDWPKDTIPQEAKASIHEKDFPDLQILYYMDFKALSYVLFSPYAKKGINNILELKQIIDEDPIDIARLKSSFEEFIPKNNWERYFKQKIDKDSSALQKEFSQLYKIRCTIAHNRFIDIEEYKSGLKLCESLITTSKQAIMQIIGIFDSLTTEAINELRETFIPSQESFQKYIQEQFPSYDKNLFLHYDDKMTDYFDDDNRNNSILSYLHHTKDLDVSYPQDIKDLRSLYSPNFKDITMPHRSSAINFDALDYNKDNCFTTLNYNNALFSTKINNLLYPQPQDSSFVQSLLNNVNDTSLENRIDNIKVINTPKKNKTDKKS